MNEFDEWVRTNMVDDTGYIEAYGRMEQAYLAGAAAGYANGVAVMREKCAEVADNFTLGRYRENEYEFDLMTERIADVIRNLEVT